MTRPATASLVFVALLWSGVARADVACPGDCNGDSTVAINEIITCVNIALDTFPVSNCPACDVNGDGMVTINELILSVNAALDGCGGIVCGNGMQEAGEECDDGNNFGGDGCAANCTTEDARVGVFDPAKTVAVVQTEALPITLNLTGQQTFRTGHKRDTDTKLANSVFVNPPYVTPSNTFPAGQIPAVIKASELLFNPVPVTGLVCACVRGIPVPAFGPGISANGAIGCSDQGLSDVNYRMVQDHDTTPGDPGNHTMGTPDDPECSDTSPAPGGGDSMACKEGTGANCSTPQNIHIGVCQGPKVITFSGGMAPKGSALIINSTAIGLLSDAGACTTSKPMRNGKCVFPDYGPDCLPCTDDDLVKGNTDIDPTTTGSAEASLYDANLSTSIIAPGQSCFGVPCMASASGSPFDCNQLTPGTGGGLSGGSLGVCFTTLDAAQINDNVTCTVFANQ